MRREKARCRGALDCLSFCLLSTMRQVHTTFLNGHTQDDACGSTDPRTHRNGTALRSPSGPGTAPSPWDSCTDTRVFYPVNGHIGDVRTPYAQTVFELTMILRRDNCGPCGASGRGTMAPSDALLASVTSACRLDGTVPCLCPTSMDWKRNQRNGNTPNPKPRSLTVMIARHALHTLRHRHLSRPQIE